MGRPLWVEGRSRALMFSFTSFLLQSDSLFKNRVPAILKKKKSILNIFKNRVCSAVHPKGCWRISNTLRRVISRLSPYKTSGVKCTPRAVLCSAPEARARWRWGRNAHTAGTDGPAHAEFTTRVRRWLHSAHAPSHTGPLFPEVGGRWFEWIAGCRGLAESQRER